MTNTLQAKRHPINRHKAKIPMRRCLLSGASTPQGDMIRFVVAPDNTVVPDIKGTLPGRGMWVTANRDAVDRAVVKQLFHRGAKRRVIIPVDLADGVADLLYKRCLQHLSLAHRAGQVLLGRDAVKMALRSGDVAVLIQACDASAKERDKLAVLAKVKNICTHRPFATGDLATALGRDHVVHVAIKSGGLADLFMGDANRLNCFVGSPTI